MAAPQHLEITNRTVPKTGRSAILRPSDFAPFERSNLQHSIVAVFERQVAAAPTRIALKTAAVSLTYEALNAWSNRIASGLLEARPGHSEPVALLFEQGVAGIAAILAVLKAGKFYLSLDPYAGPAENRAIMTYAGCTALLSDRTKIAARESIGDLSVDIMIADEISAQKSSANLNLTLSPKSLAYIFYTSGSTGRPKGVVDNHRNVLHNVMRYTNQLGIAPSDRLSLLQAPNFSGTVSSLFSALLNGATLCPFDLAARGISDLAHFLIDESVTIYHSVPAIFRALLAGDRQFLAVRVVRLEGDQSSSLDRELFETHFSSHCFLANGLGLTETGLVHQMILPHGRRLIRAGFPVGYAVEDMTTRVLDPDGRPVPAGRSGEIAVSSRYLALGYWKEPALTRSRFRRDPGKAGIRTYLTGDLGRFSADGCLEYLGRLDSRVKIRGQWADLADVEASLLKLGVFSQIVVRLWDDSGDAPRLVAYYVAGDAAVPPAQEIRARLEASLPAHMIPARYVPLEALPLTPNGKVDRAALPAPGRDRPDLDMPYRPPGDHLEDQLVQIWEQVLGVAPIGTDDAFLDLGGDSLLAMQMLLSVQETLGRHIPPRLLVEAPTVCQLARLIAGNVTNDLAAGVFALRRSGTRTPFFFLHGDYVSGGYYCHRLAKEMDVDQPFYVLPPLLPQDRPSRNTIEAMATEHIRQMRAVQPNGPFRLGGNCNGGLIAFEMARQLQAQGEQVETVVMVRTSAKVLHNRSFYGTVHNLIKAVRFDPDKRLGLLRRLRWYLEELESRPGGSIAGLNRIKCGNWLRAVVLRPRGVPSLPQASEPSEVIGPHEKRTVSIAATYGQACDDYVPDDYRGAIVLCWPEEDSQTPEQALAAWSQLCGRVELHTLPGNHISCLSRYSAAFAQILNNCLSPVSTEKAQSRI